ncbi:MAG TPA: hypothetical protein VMU87_15730 [Stellaceae bacterium]|nr:hypothetical protein [Stellaceae bacterium]
MGECEPLSFLYAAASILCARRSARRVAWTEEALVMLDTILIAAGVGFFVVAVLYVLACDKM